MWMNDARLADHASACSVTPPLKALSSIISQTLFHFSYISLDGWTCGQAEERLIYRAHSEVYDLWAR